MIPNFKISNFRIFDQDGAEFAFKPITFLTGANSSGKSSLVKSIMLIREFLEMLRGKFHATGIFDLSSEKLQPSALGLNIGSYKSCINKSAPNDIMSFSFEVSSDIAPYRYNLTYSFDGLTCDGLTCDLLGSFVREGSCNSITVSYEDEVILQMGREKGDLKLLSLKAGNILLFTFVSFLKSMSAYYEMSDSEEWKNHIKAVHLTYFKSPEIKKRYPDLFKTNFTELLKKLDQTSLLFYFPAIETYRGLSKGECIEKANQELKRPEQLQYTNRYDHFDELKERVLATYSASSFESLYDYYLNLENITLEEIHPHKFSIVAYESRRNLIKDEICENMTRNCTSQGFYEFENEEFNDIYILLTMASWEDEAAQKFIKKDFYFDYESNSPEFSSVHVLWEAYIDFVYLFFEEILLTPTFKNFRYVNDSFTSIQKMYTYNNTSSFAQVLMEYVDLRSRLDKEDFCHVNDDYYQTVVKFKSGSFVNKWLMTLFGIESLHIKSDIEGLGYMLHVTHADGNSNPLADEGHGVSQLVHILLQIECQILRKKQSILDIKNSSIINPYSLGIDKLVLAIEEPEVSLHPSLQSKLTEVFYDACMTYKVYFIVETHSEYLIRKSQAIISQYDIEGKDFKENPFKIYYFNPDGTSYEITYGESGRLENSFGPGFFDEAGNSSMEILKREKKKRK